MKSLTLIVSCIFTMNIIYGQNLIPNPSFEESFYCPNDIFTLKSKWPIKNWSRATSGTPDYFSRCSKGRVSVPYNWAGNAQPVHGDAYAGIYIWGGYTEFLRVLLKDTLEGGSTYHFEGYYQVSSNSHYVVEAMDVVFYNSKRGRSYYENPHISVRIEDPLTAKSFEWEKLSGSFIANGGENYLVIGNHQTDNLARSVEIWVNRMKEDQLKNRSYAYLDYFKLWKEGTIEPMDSTENLKKDRLTLSDVNFDLESFTLKDSAKSLLHPLINYALKLGESEYVIIINGYTDDIGETDYNLKLSRKRANSVARYLYKQGVPKNLLKVFGKGEASPLVPNDSEENRKRNRRVEIVINYL